MHPQLLIIEIVQQHERCIGHGIGADAKFRIDRTARMMNQKVLNRIDHKIALFDDEERAETSRAVEVEEVGLMDQLLGARWAASLRGKSRRSRAMA